MRCGLGFVCRRGYSQWKVNTRQYLGATQAAQTGKSANLFADGECVAIVMAGDAPSYVCASAGECVGADGALHEVIAGDVAASMVRHHGQRWVRVQAGA